MLAVWVRAVSLLFLLQSKSTAAVNFRGRETGLPVLAFRSDADDYVVESCCKGAPGQPAHDSWPDEGSPEMHDKAVRDSVDVKSDIEYREGGKGGSWKLDVYTPPGKAPEAGWPAIMLLHDGAWQEGDKGGYKPLCLDLAAVGFLTVSVNYRFVPENPFPAPVEDVMTAVRFLRAKAAEYKLNPKRLGAFGISCGAHMAALAALAQSGSGLGADGPFQGESHLLQAVAGVSMPGDLANWKGKNISHDLESSCCPNFLKGDLHTLPERARQASPMTYVGSGAPRPPPFFLVHAEEDDTVPYEGQGEKFAKAVCDLGGTSTMVKVPGEFQPGQGHGSALFVKTASALLPWFEKFFKATLMTDYSEHQCFAI